MISNQEKQECYVYLTLPHQTVPVTAGLFIYTLNRRGIPLGRFVYGKKYLERPDAVPVDPIHLKLTTNIYETNALNGIFGALRDASPDYWGRRIIARHYDKVDLSEMDYLLNAPDDGAGALGFGLNKLPPSPKRNFNQVIELEKLQCIADAIINEEELPRAAINNQIEELLLLGTSMGGARPKAVVEDEQGLWIAKFNRPDDKWNQARVEHSMLILGRICGLNVAESKIVNIGRRDVLLVKRFDRERIKEGYLRARMLSALTLLGAEDTFQSRDRWSYPALVEELRRLSSEPKKDANELFRRMCFNALISNVDDHPRNHAVIAKEYAWRLSPAYDLNPYALFSVERRELALICGDKGRFANADNILSQSPRFLLDHEEAVSIVNEMEKKVKNNWYSVARSAGVSEKDCEKMSSAFVYEGFTQLSAK